MAGLLAAAAFALPSWAAEVAKPEEAKPDGAKPDGAKPDGAKPVEPRLELPEAPGGPRVALTFDACPGGFDLRLAAALVERGVPATVFVTRTWMGQNPKGLAFLLARPDLFAIENHGARHLPPVLGATPIFGIAPAGDLPAIRREVEEGAQAVQHACGRRPRWYRAATGFYSPAAIPPIVGMGFGIGGYSLNGDLGASLPARAVAERIGAARDRDVVVAHINQPSRSSGAGVSEGIAALHRRGMRFVHLPEPA